jgi:type III pantothenate kinase
VFAVSSVVNQPIRLVADLGNSRLKWGRIGRDGGLDETIVLPIDDPRAWEAALVRLAPEGAATSWALSSVNPPLAVRHDEFLRRRGSAELRWFRSAADVPVWHLLERAETAGADRAWAVAAAMTLHPPGRAGLVVSCGTAITVERISADGVWQGGAIAPGWNLSARALHLGTAQLPLIPVQEAPPAWGRATAPALAAGLFWGTVGAVRELLARQAEGISPPPWLVWTGGDAPILSRWIAWPGAQLVSDLVLIGLARGGFGPNVPASLP